jgi:hypothetical protein
LKIYNAEIFPDLEGKGTYNKINPEDYNALKEIE